MKRNLIVLAGVLIFSLTFLVGASAQEKGTESKEVVKKELSDKELQKKLGLTKEEFEKVPEKCKNCPHLLQCKGNTAATAVKKKDSKVEKAGECAGGDEDANVMKTAEVRGKKTVKKK